MSPGCPSSDLPKGKKENVYFVVDNSDNITRLSTGKKVFLLMIVEPGQPVGPLKNIIMYTWKEDKSM